MNKEPNILELPLIGKTYSLYGRDSSSDNYYKTISSIADYYLQLFPDSDQLLELIQKSARNKSLIKKKFLKEKDQLIISLLNDLDSKLAAYTEKVEEHLQSLSPLQKADPIIAATKEQYYLYMLEVELVNRINKKKFISSNFKIAFLPHCIRDLSRECLSKPDEIDYLCKGCSKICNINLISKLLKKHDVAPYLWMTAELNPLFKKLKKEYGNFGVLGIACIPELISGMHTCLGKNIPVVGLPIDANRCARWMGKFNDNTFNLRKLEELLT